VACRRAGAAKSCTPVGVLIFSTPDAIPHGLRELGYAEGQNIDIEYRFAEGRTEQFPELAAELVRLSLTWCSRWAESVASGQQDNPIVYAMSDDPVQLGLALV
jgi:putative ABC transport system substrate-binding protein